MIIIITDIIVISSGSSNRSSINNDNTNENNHNNTSDNDNDSDNVSDDDIESDDGIDDKWTDTDFNGKDPNLQGELHRYNGRYRDV